MDRNELLIEADELVTKLSNEKIRIFDASITDDMYLQAHIPGAAFFDHEKFSDPNGKYSYTILPEAELSQKIGDIGISNDSEVIVYAWGMLPYAARAWWMLRYAGHNHVRVLNGGLSTWKDAGGRLEQEIRQYEPSTFQGQFRPKMFASKETVMEALEDGDGSVVNVLPVESYEGGHITGSSNLSCMDLMQDMDAFLPNDKLASRLKEMTRYKRIIAYCGGGIAAAVNAMAHLIVGPEEVAVYDGSLAEWIGEGHSITGTGKWAIWEKKEVKP